MAQTELELLQLRQKIRVIKSQKESMPPLMRGSNFMICVTANYEIECEGPAAVEESVVEGFWKISDVHIDARGGA